jgi:cathepsin A (carboxypeptidase C)
MRLYVSALVLGLTTSLVAGADTFANKPNSPEEIQRLPDSEWDHIIRGSDIRGKATRDTDSKDESDAYVANYDLRSKIVDPSSLGIDTVKQLSGYLDDNVQDKHLFFCELQ